MVEWNRIENMDKGLTVPNWVLIVWPKNTPNVLKIVCQICLPKPQSLEFSKNSSLWVSVVRVTEDTRCRPWPQVQLVTLPINVSSVMEFLFRLEKFTQFVNFSDAVLI